MNKYKYLMMILLAISTDNIISMEQAERIEQKLTLLDLPHELLSKIIGEEEYREAINNWNDIFEEPELNISQMQGLVSASQKLHDIYIKSFNDLKRLKGERYNELKNKIKEKYKTKGLSIKDLNKSLINILNKPQISKEDIKEAIELIIAGAYPNTANMYGRTTLAVALENDYNEFLPILIKLRSKISDRLLDMAFKKGNTLTIKLFIKSGAFDKSNTALIKVFIKR